jgi:hypothetical protein
MRKSLDLTTQERDEFKVMLDRIDTGQYLFEGGLPYLNQQDVDIDFGARVGTALQAIDDVEDENAEEHDDQTGTSPGKEGGRMDSDFGTRVGTALQAMDGPHASADHEVAAALHSDDHADGVVGGALARMRRGSLTQARPADGPRFGSASISLEEDDVDTDSDSQGDRRRKNVQSDGTGAGNAAAAADVVADDDDQEADTLLFDSASLGITFATGVGTAGRRSGAAAAAADRDDSRFTPSPDADVGANSSGDEDGDDDDDDGHRVMVAANKSMPVGMGPAHPVSANVMSPNNATHPAGT